MGQTQQIGKHATSVSTDNNDTTVRYHSTDVVQFNSKCITLNTGGFKTATTKSRMNQASNQFALGYNVYQRDYDWFVSFKDQIIPFDSDSITLTR